MECNVLNAIIKLAQLVKIVKLSVFKDAPILVKLVLHNKLVLLVQTDFF